MRWARWVTASCAFATGAACSGDGAASCEDDAPAVLEAIADDLADVAPPATRESQAITCEDSGAGHGQEERWTYPGDDSLGALVDVRDHLEAAGWAAAEDPDDFVGLGGSYELEVDGVDVFVVVALEEAGGDLRVSVLED